MMERAISKKKTAFLIFVACTVIMGVCIAGCGIQKRIPIREYSPPQERMLPPQTDLLTVGFDRLLVDIDRGEVIGAQHSEFSQNETAKCNCGQRYELNWGHANNQFKLRNDDLFAMSFYEALVRKGYKTAWKEGVSFNRKNDLAMSELSVSARIYEMTANICNLCSVWDSRSLRLVEAEVDLLVEWFVYDLDLKKEVLRVKTRGYTPELESHPYGFQLSLAQAFMTAARELSNDPKFMEVVRKKTGE